MNAHTFGSYLVDNMITKIEKEKGWPICFNDLRTAKRNQIINCIFNFLRMEMICRAGQLLLIKWVIDVESRQFPSKLVTINRDIMRISSSN